MTLAGTRRVSDLLVTLDDAREWRESFEEATRPFIFFDEVSAADDLRGDGTHNGWAGPLRLPRELAAEMMGWLEKRATEELQKLGIEQPTNPS